MPGRFIALEGGDGCGKSTQARLLAEHLDARLTREPGGTPVSERLREIVLDPATGELDLRAEVLLIAAGRADHVAKVIRPTLATGQDVVTDRYFGSSLAYQGYGRELDVDDVRNINLWATADLVPDLTILVEVTDAVAAARLDRDLDRLESLGDAFHRRVAAGYRALAVRDGWAIVDGDGTIDEVFTRVVGVVEERLP